jgi:hypothetical protein
VLDAATKKPIANAAVTATSPMLQGEQTVPTDAAGDYSIHDLPAGTYTLQMDADGYRPYTRSDIVLHMNLTIRINAELLPDSVEPGGT